MPLKISCLILLIASTLSASEWPQFRGPNGDGIAPAGKAPTKWSETEGITWKTPLPGKGWSSPVEADGKLWITTAIEDRPSEEEMLKIFERAGTDPKKIKQLQVVKGIQLLLLVVDLKSGELVATKELIRVAEPEPIHGFNSYSSPTPYIDGEFIYCHFGTYGTVCLKRSDLSVVWKRSLPLEHSVGPGSSPFIDDNRLVLICDGCDRQYVTALDKYTGETLWEVDRPEMDAPDGDRKKAFDTPIAVTDKSGRKQLICMGSQWLVSYAPETGKELWKVYHGKGFSVVPRPVVHDDVVYISTGFGKAQLWAVRIDGEGDVTDSHVAWTVARGIPTKPSPIVFADAVFVIEDKGVGSCFDTKSGEILWQERISGNYSASPLLADGKVYICSEEGKTTVFKPGRAYEEITVNELNGRIMASPILVDDALFIRTDEALYRIDAES